jgi:hypothetical protein
MKSIFLPLFVLLFFSSHAQFKLRPHFGINISTGPATYYNPTISNIGFAHDYKYGQASQIGIKAIQHYQNWNFSAGLNYQYLFFAYRGVNSIYIFNPNYPNSYYYDIYYSNSIQHFAQVQIGCARSFGNGLELGIKLMPSYLVSSKDTYTIERIWGAAPPNMMNNNSGWCKTQLIGGLSFSKHFISKKEKTSQLSLDPQIAIVNNGGFNVYNQAFSDLTVRKTRFVSCQLSYTVFF